MTSNWVNQDYWDETFGTEMHCALIDHLNYFASALNPVENNELNIQSPLIPQTDDQSVSSLEETQTELENETFGTEMHCALIDHMNYFASALNPVGNNELNIQSPTIPQTDDQSVSSLEETQTELEKTQTELEKTQTELEKAQTELEKAQTELEKAQTELEVAQKKVEEAQKCMIKLSPPFDYRLSYIELGLVISCITLALIHLTLF